MYTTINYLSSILRDNNIKPSIQRIKVLEYLYNNRTHPMADEIYKALHIEIPSLSKTTIYNTLNTLVKAGLVRLITIEDNITRYDYDTSSHGHFKCNKCGDIFDFNINLEHLSKATLNGFKVTSKDVYYKGLCSYCNNIK